MLGCVVALALAPGVRGATAETTAAEPTSEAFDIFEFRVLGSTAVPAVDVERAVYPMLGEGRTIKEVEQARDALAELYRGRGFGAVNVDIPEQDVADGVVRLQVTEGRLGQVKVTGARYYSSGRIVRSMPSLQSGEVLNLPALQSDLAAVNRMSADRTVTPVLRSGQVPGTVDLELKVRDELPIIAQFEVNDRYTADTTRTRAIATLGYGNLFQKFHSLSLQYQSAPEEPDEARVFAATYLAPIGDEGRLLAGYYVNTDSDVSTVGTLSVIGAGQIYGARYVIPLPSIEHLYHGFTLGLDYKDFNDKVVLEDGRDQTPVAYTNWSMAYNGTLRYEKNSTSFNLAANFGSGSLGNDADEFAYKRYGAKPNYFYLRGGLRHERALPFPGRLFARVDAQGTTVPLISNEQFSIGGVDSVRGYLEAEALGDVGMSGSLEWHTPPFNAYLGDWLQDSYFLVFTDAGFINLIDPLPGQTDWVDLYSAGVGLRVTAFGGLIAALDWAYPFVSGEYTESGDSRVHFLVRYEF